MTNLDRESRILGCYTLDAFEMISDIGPTVDNLDPSKIGAFRHLSWGEQGEVLDAYESLEEAILLLTIGLETWLPIRTIIYKRAQDENGKIEPSDTMPLAEALIAGGKDLMHAQKTGEEILASNGLMSKKNFATLKKRFLISSGIVSGLITFGFNFLKEHSSIATLTAEMLAIRLADLAPEIVDDCVAAIDFEQLNKLAEELLGKERPKEAFAQDIVTMVVEASSKVKAQETADSSQWIRLMLTGLLKEWETSVTNSEDYPFISWAWAFLETKLDITIPHLKTVFNKFSDKEVLTIAGPVGEALSILAKPYTDIAAPDPAGQEELQQFHQIVEELGKASKDEAFEQADNSRPSKVNIDSLGKNIIQLSKATVAFIPKDTCQAEQDFKTLMEAVDTIRRRVGA